MTAFYTTSSSSSSSSGGALSSFRSRRSSRASLRRAPFVATPPTTSHHRRKNPWRRYRGGGSCSGNPATTTALCASASVFETAMQKAFRGGLTGSAAGVLQVLMFMWLRTVMNYQYRHGGDGPAVFRKLWGEGGVPRLYRGLPFAIVQGPLSRFGSAAANTLVMTMRQDDVLGLAAYPVFAVTFLGSILTACYRAALMPIDTLKIVSQVEGKGGFKAVLRAAFLERKIYLLYTGAYAMAAATLIGHYPWFLSYNVLDLAIPKPDVSDAFRRALRSAVIGFTSSLVSDVISNPIRVIKTTKQSSAANRALDPDNADAHKSYASIVSYIATHHGVSAFFVRGLSTRILANGLQSMVFTVIWRALLGE